VIGRNEEPMLVMEYMDNGSLYDLLHNETMAIEGEYILPILRDIVQGVRFLHAATPKVIHGDLKAQNILVDGKFRSKVADFGLSQKKCVGATGTPFWMAPELLTGESPNSSSTDVYSFGIILYELYSRKDPYEGEDAMEVLKQVADPLINKRPPTPMSCPPEIQALMTECLSGEPERRPSFRDMDMRLKSYDVSTVEPGETHFSAQYKKEKRTSSLLYEVFPERIASALRDGRKVEPESRDMVTIFFSDIVGFTDISSMLSPIQVSDLLDRLYSQFDSLSRVHDVFKVETIGDAYMAVTNLTKHQSDHTKRIAEFAIAAVAAANQTVIDPTEPNSATVSIRVGFHCGPVVANVVGSRNPRYCLFGDAVNTAARMESNSMANRIHCSEAAALQLQLQDLNMKIVSRGKIPVKGKGLMRTYWVNEADIAPESSRGNISSMGVDLGVDKDSDLPCPTRHTSKRSSSSDTGSFLPSFSSHGTKEDSKTRSPPEACDIADNHPTAINSDGNKLLIGLSRPAPRRTRTAEDFRRSKRSLMRIAMSSRSVDGLDVGRQDENIAN
jgi:class 3 adenylate cyclase